MKHEITTLNTKKTLAASLKKLMMHKPLGKISISELITDCGVNRKTFYYHFQDIYDLLKWILEQEAIEVVKGFDLLVNPEEALLFAIGYVDENKHIINCAYDAMGREEMKRFSLRTSTAWYSPSFRIFCRSKSFVFPTILYHLSSPSIRKRLPEC